MKRLTRIHPDLSGYSFSFDPELLAPIEASYRKDILPYLDRPEIRSALTQGGRLRLPVGPEPCEYFIFNYLDYPLLWFCNHSEKSFTLFENFFDALDLQDDLRCLVDFEHKVQFYSGFFVICDRYAPVPSWHVDFVPGAHAYTMIAPLGELDPDHGHLLYTHLDRSEAVYTYKAGEGILFGEAFRHSTQPFGPSRRLRVLVSFTCGSDKMMYWEKIEKTVRRNSYYFKLPCGHVDGTCECVSSYQYALEYSRNLLRGFRPFS